MVACLLFREWTPAAGVSKGAEPAHSDAMIPYNT